MLGASESGRVRLNIISTQFLDGDSGLIWIAQFLAAAGRFIMQSPAPEGRLQGVLMFDEADQYVPATRKPVTKPGMENLIRRARSAGVGIMLATQNVGDFDYKAVENISTAFAGKLNAPRTFEKLRSRFGTYTDRLSKKSSGQFIMGIDGEIREIKANMCLVKPTQVLPEEIERIANTQAQTLARGSTSV